MTETFLITTATVSRKTCFYILWGLDIAPGTAALVGTIGPPSESIDFYIMTQQQYSSFQTSECGTGPYDALVAAHPLSSTSSYALDWKNPPPGSYFIILDSENLPLKPITVPMTIEGVFYLAQNVTTTTINTTVIMTTYQSTTTITVYQTTTTVTST